MNSHSVYAGHLHACQLLLPTAPNDAQVEQDITARLKRTTPQMYAIWRRRNTLTARLFFGQELLGRAQGPLLGVLFFCTSGLLLPFAVAQQRHVAVLRTEEDRAAFAERTTGSAPALPFFSSRKSTTSAAAPRLELGRSAGAWQPKLLAVNTTRACVSTKNGNGNRCQRLSNLSVFYKQRISPS